MTEILVYGRNLPEAYHEALVNLYVEGEECPCPDYNTTQKEVSMTMVVEEALAEPMISKLFIGGPRELEQYRQEIVHGILDFEVEKGNWAYTYHSRMAEQIPLVIEELRRNFDTRRAVIQVRDWQTDIHSSDPACLQHIQYFIREGALHCKVLFRSNDACKAAFMNAFGLIMLQKYIAEEVGVPVGSYTHRANSFHCYARDYDMLDDYINSLYMNGCDLKSLAYNYVGDWDEQMEDAKEEIAALVEELRSHGA